MKGFAAAVLVFTCSFPMIARAQDSTEVLSRMKAMEERILALEAEVQALRSQQAGPQTSAVALVPAVLTTPQNTPALVATAQGAAAPQPIPAPPQAVPYPQQNPTALGGAGGAASKVLNPDIAVIGDFLGAAGNGAGHGTPSLEMHESEVAFQAILDPYARADFFISFGEQGVNLEEGYLTFPALKGGFELRVGKMRADFGVVNTLHNHVLPWIDRPLVTQNLVGGEDGIDDAGFSLSRIIPAPKGIFLEATAELFRGDSGDLFRAYNRDSVSTVEHLRAYRDITESTNLSLGGSFSRGHSTLGPSVINQLYGIDATLRWKPLRRSIYHSFVGRGEYIWSRVAEQELMRTPSGYYVSGDYQFARRWFAGGRFDRSERITEEGTSPSSLNLLRDTGGSLILTYWPSEFSQIRAQLRRTHYGENATANELLFQFQFSIGAHGAHPF